MLEREFTPEISKDRILQAARSSDFSFQINYINALQTVATCVLIDKHGAVVAEGAGKGVQAEIGAMAESLEHHALSRYDSKNLVKTVVDEIRHQSQLSMDGLIANLPKTQSEIDCAIFFDSQSGATVKLPAVLFLPESALIEDVRSDERLSYLCRYSSNSGIAFGCSENEAILHGINEVIERHVLSKILMSLCGQYDKLPLSHPDAQALEDIFSEYPEIRSDAEGMKILFFKTIYGVYFSMAIPKRPNGRHPTCLIGSGCSVDARVAIKRAVTELLQCTLLFDESEAASDLKAYAFLQSSVKLRPLIGLEMLRNIEHISRRLDPPVHSSVADQIAFIREKVSGTGLRILQRTLMNFDNGCAVVHTYIPGLERFNLIRAGVPVVPQRLLHANRSFG